MLTIYLMTLVSAVLISIFIKPILWNRYMFVCIGAILLPASIGINYIKIRGLKDSAVISACLITYLALSVKQLYTDRTHLFNGPIYSVMQNINDSGIHPDVFIHLDENTAKEFAYYYPGVRNYLYFPEGMHLYSNLKIYNNIYLSGSISNILENNREAWLVVGNSIEMTNECSQWFKNGLIKPDGGFCLRRAGMFQIYRIKSMINAY